MMRIAIPLALLAGCAGAFANVPGPALAALQRQAGDAAIDDVENETDNGVVLYEGAWKRDGVRHEAKVTADGDVVELEESVAATAVPARVREAAAKLFGASARFVRKTWIVYEVEGQSGGKWQEVIFTPTGRTTPELEDDDGDDDEDDDDDDGDGRAAAP